MNSIQLSIEAAEEQQEILISQLSDLGADGFEQTDNYLIAYFNENTFKSYEINELLKEYSFTTNTIEEKNWNEVWESNFEPVVVNNFCAIRAEFHQPITTVEHEIIITPKMSFGTGHHATTYMMIEQMQHIDFKNKTVFDFGTGTGILSIVAEKLGALSITAIDVDDWSITNTRENIEKNDCSKISVSLSSQIPKHKFDIVLANINRNVILSYLPELNAGLKENSYLLLSGLLTSDEKDIMEACSSHNLRLLKHTERNNWISLLLVKTV
ncbi:MAG TPA: 50S ribosomal protein L11 methyltransferase [Flavisolibacter sp.]|nr:50S ribosomal protein L11 methyltransferase [Flavisolibacter sp.]